MTLVSINYGKVTQAHEGLSLVLEPLGAALADDLAGVNLVSLEDQRTEVDLAMEKNELFHGEPPFGGVGC